MKTRQLSVAFRGHLWSLWEWIEMKHLSPIDAIKRTTQRIIKPRARPSEVLGALRPNWEQVIGEIYGELGPNCNIFDVDAENDKHKRPNVEPYRLTIWKTERFRFRLEK